jgi:hypothetical protein
VQNNFRNTIGCEADIDGKAKPAESVENDPTETLAVHCGKDLMSVSAPIEVLV